MRIPYYYPDRFIFGQQIFSPGNGGPSSWMGILATAPVSRPTAWPVRTMGLGAMPRQVIGPSLASSANNYSDPDVWNNLIINGLRKSSVPQRS